MTSTFFSDNPIIHPLDDRPPTQSYFWWLNPRKFASWYLARCQWHGIRALGSTSIVRLSAIAPIVGYLILANEFTFRMFEGWKLYCFYFGTLSIAMGAFVYSLRCPGEAKKYDTAIEYTSAEAEFFTANPKIIEKEIAKSLVEVHHQRPEVFRDLLTIVSGIIRSQRDAERDTRKDAIISLMDELWHLRNFIRRRSRITCRILYDLGIVLVFSPSIVTSFQILEVALPAFSNAHH